MGVGCVAAPFPSLLAFTPPPLPNMNVTVSMIDVGKELHGVKKNRVYFLGPPFLVDLRVPVVIHLQVIIYMNAYSLKTSQC